MNLEFLKSRRFWVMVAGAVATYSYLKGWIGYEETVLIDLISGGFITVRTADRHGEMK